MTRRRLAMLAAVATALSTRPTLAEPTAAGDLSLDATGAHLDAPERETSFALLGLGLRGAIGDPWIGYRAGLDARLGAALEGGFAYDAALYPLGLSFPVAEPAALGLIAGIGASGVTSRIPSSGRIPLEISLDVSAAPWLRFESWFRPAWCFAAHRADGSRALSLADEFDAGMAFRFGKGGEEYGMHFGRGVLVGAFYGEQLGGQLFGAVIGHALDIRNP